MQHLTSCFYKPLYDMLYFNLLVFTPLVRDGFLPWGYRDDQILDTQAWTDGSDSSLLVTYIHSLVEEHTSCHTGPHGGCTGEWSEQPWLWKQAL